MLKKGPILRVIFSKSSILEGHILFIKKGSSLWVILKKKKVQFFESLKKKESVQFFESYWKECTILWVIFEKGFNSVSHIQKKISLSHVGKQEGFNSLTHIRKAFNSLSYIRKRVQFFESYFQKGSILWVIFNKKEVQCFRVFFFLKTRAILWGILPRKFNSLSLFLSKKKRFNSLSHVQKKFNSLSHTKKGPVVFLRYTVVQCQAWPVTVSMVQLQRRREKEDPNKKRTNCLSHVKKAQAFESCQKEGSIL